MHSLPEWVSLNLCPCPYNYSAPACFKCLSYALLAVYNSSRGEVRTLDMMHQLVNCDLRVVDICNDGINRFS